MYDSFIDTLEFFPRGLVYVALGIVVLVVAKLVLDLVTPYKINRQLAEKNNSALGLSITGYFMGVIIVFAGVFVLLLLGAGYVWWSARRAQRQRAVGGDGDALALALGEVVVGVLLPGAGAAGFSGVGHQQDECQTGEQGADGDSDHGDFLNVSSRLCSPTST